MNADSDIQVWLETIARTQPSVIVPYVQSTESGSLRYKVRTIRQSTQGRSEIAQGGTVTLVADTPVALGRMAISRSPGDACQVELTIQKEGDAGADASKRYQFSCPN